MLIEHPERTGKVLSISKPSNSFLNKITGKINDKTEVKIFVRGNGEDLQNRLYTFEVNEDFRPLKVNERDLVRFIEGDENSIVKIPSNNFDSKELLTILREVHTLTVDELIAYHNSLINLFDDSNVFSCTADEILIIGLLNYNYGVGGCIEIPQVINEFFNTSYFSNYFSNLINERIAKPSEIINDFLESSKELSDLTAEEWNEIYVTLKEVGKKTNGFDYTTYNFLNSAYFINSEGAKNFINDYLEPMDVIERIIKTSGFKDLHEYATSEQTYIEKETQEMVQQKLDSAEVEIYEELEEFKKDIYNQLLGIQNLFEESLSNFSENAEVDKTPQEKVENTSKLEETTKNNKTQDNQRKSGAANNDTALNHCLGHARYVLNQNHNNDLLFIQESIDAKRLFSIYKKIDAIDSEKGKAFVILAYNLQTLGIVDFLSSLYKLVKNNYEVTGDIIVPGKSEQELEVLSKIQQEFSNMVEEFLQEKESTNSNELILK